jgi:hypothetical protein
MDVPKGRDGAEAANQLVVLLAAVRLPAHQADLVVTLNTPIVIHPASSAAADAGAGQQQGHARAPALFAAMLRSLAIVDYGLFG